jgi:SAM-dependent methyltransferase
MDEQTRGPWYEQDGFWQTFEPAIFDEQRLSLAAEEVEQIIALLALEPGRHVCDLWCGVGRHTLELARRGLVVTAVDRTRRYLESARSGARQAGLEIEFVQEDMRDFSRSEAFDAVVNVFTSFGYFDAQADDRRVVENAYRSLRPGGRLLLDMVGKEIIARIFQSRDWHETSAGTVLYDRKVAQDWSRIENRWILIKDGHMHEWRFSHQVYSAAELHTLLGGCGFRNMQAFGGLQGTPYDEKAERLVVVGYK